MASECPGHCWKKLDSSAAISSLRSRWRERLKAQLDSAFVLWLSGVPVTGVPKLRVVTGWQYVHSEAMLCSSGWRPSLTRHLAKWGVPVTVVLNWICRVALCSVRSRSAGLVDGAAWLGIFWVYHFTSLIWIPRKRVGPVGSTGHCGLKLVLWVALCSFRSHLQDWLKAQLDSAPIR